MDSKPDISEALILKFLYSECNCFPWTISKSYKVYLRVALQIIFEPVQKTRTKNISNILSSLCDFIF